VTKTSHDKKISYLNDKFTQVSSNPSIDICTMTLKTASATSSLSATQESKQLWEGFLPTDLDVICGRGKGSYNKPGNKRFRALVKTYLNDYISARTKFAKSAVLQDILNHVRASGGRFIKYSKHHQPGWSELSDDQAREKVGHAVRESITASCSSIPKAESLVVKKDTQVDDRQVDLLEEQRKSFDRLIHQLVSAKNQLNMGLNNPCPPNYSIVYQDSYSVAV
jgi:hypothetical protein